MSFSFSGAGHIRLGTMCLDAPHLQYELQFWPCSSVKDMRHTKFSLEEDGRVRLMTDPSRCVSVNDETEKGGQGPMLELRACNSTLADKWSVEGSSGYMAGAKLN